MLTRFENFAATVTAILVPLGIAAMGYCYFYNMPEIYSETHGVSPWVVLGAAVALSIIWMLAGSWRNNRPVYMKIRQYEGRIVTVHSSYMDHDLAEPIEVTVHGTLEAEWGGWSVSPINGVDEGHGLINDIADIHDLDDSDGTLTITLYTLWVDDRPQAAVNNGDYYEYS